jgi:cobalt-precorrin-5B (C1)-methyltransferase
MEFMAKVASECSSSTVVIEEVKKANTARHVSEIIDAHRVEGFYNSLCRKVFERLYEYSDGRIDLQVIMFDFDGKVRGFHPSQY